MAVQARDRVAKHPAYIRCPFLPGCPKCPLLNILQKTGQFYFSATVTGT